ncbi:M1 family aminopeptidase [Pedobacter gandavensis]|uniref:Aminopeptidase N n=1 Tax=Pedobacter gandavensis TaxID=2679963 RepID=A0ABR6EZV9_9SPHI|nr:M1 family aminopeptidase [Pedobacter gandavensis]MBB2150789.1 aminopeptidase [Pedobacter gandavensis]
MLNVRPVFPVFAFIFPVLAAVFLSCATVKPLPDPGVETGVSRSLANYRKANISEVQYLMELDIPAEKVQKIGGLAEISFQLKATKYPLQLDFKEDQSRIKKLSVNSVSVGINLQKEHLLVDQQYLKVGRNVVNIEFWAGDGALNRNADYLYTLFVPDRARTVFPCFDQPDLKAVYTLTLKVPEDWKAIANAKLKDSMVVNARKTYRFQPSDTISTYLFSFSAGKFEEITGQMDHLKANFLYRETDTAKLNHSLNEIFKIHGNSLKFMENWTGIAYPFQKFDFVSIPDFQFGGMEHVGAIQYKESSLFLDGGATKDQLNSRVNLIAHETAHMWFGDLVTMDWFTDVWMKEVFANFMADKSTEGLTGKADFDLKFLVDHFPAAYGVDRSIGANPIRQDLGNLKDAGTLYGNIIYHKAPIMMRQLERLMGKEKFQQGVSEYLKKFANGNASWPDLIAILDKYAAEDLQKWNKVWVNDSGRPVIDYQLEKKDGKITSFKVQQKPEYGNRNGRNNNAINNNVGNESAEKGKIWPQLFELSLYYPDGVKELTVNLNAKEVEVKEAIGMDLPLFLQFNSSGQGYGVWPVDPAMYAAQDQFSVFAEMKAPLNRASAYISLYENMLNGRSIKPAVLLDLLMSRLVSEKDELNLKLITGYIGVIFWEFSSTEERLAIQEKLERTLWNAMVNEPLANHKKLLFKAYQDVFLSKTAADRLLQIWKNQQAPQGLILSEDDYTALTFALALRMNDNADLLQSQLDRIKNVDRRKRFEFIKPAVSSELSDRNAFFKRLELKANREKEANVGVALYYLHHPLRQSTSIAYLPKSLEMLAEIQTTGDIFFPQSWLQSTFSYYQTEQAVQVVTDFLNANPDYNPKLKAKILQATDYLYRASRLKKNMSMEE